MTDFQNETSKFFKWGSIKEKIDTYALIRIQSQIQIQIYNSHIYVRLIRDYLKRVANYDELKWYNLHKVCFLQNDNCHKILTSLVCIF